MARPERVAFGLSLAFSSSELMNTRKRKSRNVKICVEQLNS